MSALLGLLGVVLFIVGIILAIVRLARKKKVIHGIIILVIGIVLFVIGIAIPDTSNTTTKETIVSSDETERKASVASVTSIRAEYKGQSAEGIVLSNKNDHIHVYAEYSDGTESMVNEWDIAEPQTLTAGETSTVTITASGYSCDLSVECTTKTQEQIENEYKEECQDVSYEDLARNPDSMTGQAIHTTAHIIYIYGDVHDSVGCSAGMTYDETYKAWNDEVYLLVPYNDGTRVLNDDVIEIWGTYEGLSNNTDFMVSTNSAPYIEVKYWNFVE